MKEALDGLKLLVAYEEKGKTQMFAYQGNKNYKGINGPHKRPPGNQPPPPKLRSS